MRFTLAGADIVSGGVRRSGWSLVVADTSIQAVAPSATLSGPVIDATDTLIVPGFIDLHTHGGGGYALHTEYPEEILAYARWVARFGTTAFLVNVVGVPDGLPERQLAAAARAIGSGSHDAEPVGIYLEGPYLNPKRRGAHQPSWLRQPRLEDLPSLLAASQGLLRIVTLAPELPDASLLLKEFVRHGVTVAIGHTEATYEEVKAAFRAGARLVTHCFNAMPGLHHRSPGPIGALVEHTEVVGELIADGYHVLPPVMTLLIRALGARRIAVITDAQPATGLPPGTTFSFAGVPARVEEQVVRLCDGTLAGSVLTMDQALRNLVTLVGLSLEDAVTMLTATPARVVGLSQRKGSLSPGYDADFVVLSRDLTVLATFCRGRATFVTDLWRERLEQAGALALVGARDGEEV